MYTIQELVPHSGKMSLLDAVVGYDEKTLSAQVTITEESQFFTDEGVPALVGIEYMGQAIAAYGGVLSRNNDQAIKIGFLVSARKYRSNVPFFPLGAKLDVYIEEYSEEVNGLQVFRCSIQGDEINVEARLNVFVPQNVADFLEEKNRE